MPVLRQDDMREIVHQGVDARHDGVAARHREVAAGAEAGLHVDHDEGVGRGSGMGLRLLALERRERGQPLALPEVFSARRRAAACDGWLRICRGHGHRRRLLPLRALRRPGRPARAVAARLPRRAAYAGTVLLAPEGVNGTIAGRDDGVAAVLAASAGPARAARRWRPSSRGAEAMPFGKLKVRLKREIVTMGQPGVDPRAGVGRYVPPSRVERRGARIRTPSSSTRATPTRSRSGRFAGAVDPGTRGLRRLSRPGGRRTATRLAGKRDRDVLHRRHPLREVDGLPATAGGGGCGASAGRYPEISRGGAGGREPVAGRAASSSTTGSAWVTGWCRASTCSAMPAVGR